MSNWVETIVQKHEEYEPPLSFWRWSALCAISAVVKDNVWMQRYTYQCYPNIYVMLHADSGMKKGPPVAMAKKLVTMVGNTNVFAGRSSIQGILKALSVSNSKSAPGGKIIENTSTGFICASELSSSLVGDPVATTILTDLYDRNYNDTNWESLLKMETFKLNKPTLSMLSATNEAHADEFFSRKDYMGGFFARTFIVYEKEENRSNSLLIPPDNVLDYKDAVGYLRELSQLRGEFTKLGSLEPTELHTESSINPATNKMAYFTPAGLVYLQWYHDFKQRIKGVKEATGTINRFGDSVLKVAMLLSLAESKELNISESAMNQSIEYCEQLLGNTRQVTLGKTEKEESNSSRKVILLQELLNRETHSITMIQLLRKYQFQGSTNEWQEVCKDYEASGVVELVTVGNQLVIQMSEKAIKEIGSHMEGKN